MDKFPMGEADMEFVEAMTDALNAYRKFILLTALGDCGPSIGVEQKKAEAQFRDALRKPVTMFVRAGFKEDE